jgi:hypothetical protein
MSDRRIPDGKENFDTFFTEVKIFLVQIITGVITMGENLGMTANEMIKFNNFFKAWRSSDPAAPGVYEKYLDPEKQGKFTAAEVKKFISDFTVWFSPILVRMSGSPNITPQYRQVLHIAEPVTSRTHPTEVIAEECYYKAVHMGGGMLKFGFSPSESGGRAHKPVNSDAVEFAWRLDEPYVPTAAEIASSGGNSETVSKVKYKLASPDDGTTKDISTKASFIKKYGPENIAKILQFFARFINTKHRDLDGPWTGPFTTTIS